jgi:hypothetical protein
VNYLKKKIEKNKYKNKKEEYFLGKKRNIKEKSLKRTSLEKANNVMKNYTKKRKMYSASNNNYQERVNVSSK